MTISSSTRKAGPYNGNGVTTSFAFAFKVFSSADIVVVKTSSLGIETTLELTTHYTVSLNADQDADPGGTVTYASLTTGTKLTITGALSELQPTDITNGSGFYPRVIENALDRSVILLQQVREVLNRTLKFPVSTSSNPTNLPSAANRANKAIVFGADGDVTVSDDDYNDQLANVSAQATAAAASATEAADSATEAADSATDAADSATAAASSASAASTSATAAASSASAASTSATAAASSASAASTSASSASTSATNAASSASSASTSATNAASSASSASTSATNAAASETGAATSAAKLKGTSTTSLAISVASKVFTTQSGKQFNDGQFLLIVSDAAPSTDWMFGQITSYSGTSLTVNVSVVGGSGTHTDWTIYVAGARGETGATGASGSVPVGAAGGTVNAITSTISGATTVNQQIVAVVSAGENTSTTPTFKLGSDTAYTITARGGVALRPGDIGPAGYLLILEHNSANTRWELINPVGKAVNCSRVTVASHATTGDIWNIAGNQVDWTGTATTTAFPNAPHAGIERVLICAAACSFTAGANMLIEGVSSGSTFAAAANDEVIVRAISTTQFKLTIKKYSGLPVVAIGTGGTTRTASFTFNPGDSYSQKITPTAYGQAVTFADATTFTKGTICSVWNNSDYWVAINDSTGVTRGFIGPYKTVIVSLSDNSTAAGVWSIAGSDLLGITASTFSTTTSGADNGKLQFISLDSDRSLFLYGSTSCYARVHRKSTNAWSSPVLVRASLGTNAFIGVKSATNQVLVCSNDATTAMEAVALSVNASTDAITVNTAATATLSGNWAAYGQLIAVGSSWVLSYGRATNVSAIRALTISGTTVTIGSEATLTPSVATAGQLYAVSSSVVLTLNASASTFYSLPFTVSGSSCSAGTGATSSNGAATFRSIAVGTRWHAVILDTTLKGVVISVSGTTSTHSVATLSATAAVAPVAGSDMLGISSSKSCVMMTNSAAAVYVNHLIDTAGTASAGTEIAIDTTTVAASSSGGATGIAAISAASNTCKFAATSTAAAHTMYVIDSSGTSPVLSDIFESGGATVSAAYTPKPAPPTSALGVRDKALVYSTSCAITISRFNTLFGGGGFVYGAHLSVVPALPIPGSAATFVGDNGLTSAESWFYRCGPAGGINQIVKVEAAQP